MFVTATPEVRAQRRYEELIARGQDTTYAAVLADVQERDRRDSERSAAPLKPAQGAEVLDTSELGIEAAVAAAIALVEEARA